MLNSPKKTIYFKTFLPIVFLLSPIWVYAFSVSDFWEMLTGKEKQQKIQTNFKEENLQSLKVLEPNKLFSENEIIDTRKVDIVDDRLLSFESQKDFIDDFESEFYDNHSQNAVYTVQKGDSIYSIASYFGVSVDTIMTFNHMTSKTVHVGDVLEVPSVSGVLYTVKKGDTLAGLAKKYLVDQEDVTLYNGLLASDMLVVGDEIFLPNAKEDEVVKKTTKITKTTGNVATTKTFTKDATVGKTTWARGDTSHLNTTSAIKKYSTLPKYEGYFLFPAPGATRTQKMHGNNGVDLANKIGSPVLAAAGGVVSVAKTGGYNFGYGNYIKITHPNGTETIYGHLSRVDVKSGESVSKGQQIGAVGSTGNSTGPHLHFEIHGAYNPFAW